MPTIMPYTGSPGLTNMRPRSRSFHRGRNMDTRAPASQCRYVA